MELEAKKELGYIAKTLCGTQAPEFPGEAAQCLYQLKHWLNSDGDDYASLREGAQLYAGLHIAYRISEITHRQPKVSPAAAFVHLAKNKETQEFFREWMEAQEDFAWSGGPSLNPRYHNDDSIIYSVNHHTYLCLCSWLKRKIKFKQWARDCYMQDCDNDNELLREISPHLATLRTRLAFLLPAERMKDMFYIETDGTAAFFQQLEAQAGATKMFQKYFSYCGYIQDVLRRGRKELHGKLVARWAGVELAKPPGLVAR